jgi:uncharacterized protein YndB with AHSA1/START domain
MTSHIAARHRHGSAVITLPSETEILITRRFDAPAELVFRALTTPALVRRWWGFPTSEWLVCEIDLREGGRWRYVVREGDAVIGFHGEYREIARPHRLVATEVFEGLPGSSAAPAAGADADAALVTTTLDEAGGVTTMTVLVRHARPEYRDAHLASGMESGLQVAYDRLEELVRQAA